MKSSSGLFDQLLVLTCVAGHLRRSGETASADAITQVQEELYKGFAGVFNSRFYLDQDGDCHWFIVPVRLKVEWEAWLETGEEEDWPEPPDGCTPIGGAPSLVTFADPREEG